MPSHDQHNRNPHVGQKFRGVYSMSKASHAACVDMTFVVDVVPDAVIREGEGYEAASQCGRDRTAVQADVRTLIA